MCEPGTCEDCCSTDEWIAPADLRRPPAASVEAPVSDARPEPVHGLTAALRALGRDGGEQA